VGMRQTWDYVSPADVGVPIQPSAATWHPEATRKDRCPPFELSSEHCRPDVPPTISNRSNVFLLPY
jgi:hypothetical protein